MPEVETFDEENDEHVENKASSKKLLQPMT